MPRRIASVQRKNYALRAFLWGLLLASVMVVPVMIVDKGYFLYYGDFNAQQIPFYQHAHDMILSGGTDWDHLTDLGVNFIGSYSFYLLCSPFFLLTLLLPSAAVPYAMGPLLMLKLGCCSLSGYVFLRRYVRDKRYAVIGGLLYAFSGFSLYNVFFFHFHEPMILFPLLLAAMDEFHATKRRGLVALALFACAAVNYYFFFGQAVFLLIYYVLKLICKSYRFRVKEFLCLVFEAVIGVLAACFILLPSVAAITGNYRVGEFINGWNALVYPSSQRYVQIAVGALFPGDIPARANFTPDAGGKWSSVAMYLPVVSLVFPIAYLRKHKKSFSRRLWIVLIVMALIPGLNSLFQALNTVYYARWFYMITLVAALMTVRSLDELKECEFKKGFVPLAAVTAAISLLIGLMPYVASKSEDVTVYRFGIEKSPSRFWIFCGISVGGLILTLLLYILFRKKPKYFLRCLSLTLSLFIAAYGSIYLWVGKRQTDFSDSFLITQALDNSAITGLDDIKEVRSDFRDTQDNLAMYWGIPSIQAFHSIVPGSLMDFYNKSGVQRDVGSRPSTDLYGFRALLSVKYLFAEEIKRPGIVKDAHMAYFTYLKTENGFDIFENECYIPMGFTYDTYICEEEYLSLSDDVKHLALLKAMVLPQNLMKKYRDITGYTDGMYVDLNAQFDVNHPQKKRYPTFYSYKSVIEGFDYSQEAYREDALNRSKSACSSFCYTDGGFDAEFDNTGGDTLLFFSIPYDEGWSAQVNGRDVEIEKVNIGMMAIRVNGHEKSVIRFRYKTPMLKEGLIVSGTAILLFIPYLILTKGFRAKRDTRRKYRIKKNKTTKEATK